MSGNSVVSFIVFFFSSRRRHTRLQGDWSSDVCSSDLASLGTLAACRRKPIANALLQQAGLPIPRWTVAQGKIEDDFPLPAIVKPASEDASAGLDRGSVVSDRKSLRARLAAMTEQFDEV